MVPRNDHILIVGSGFGGLGLAIRLKAAGITDFSILEQANEVGGTWRDNTYPGAACDVQSHLYCFSFEPNPDWSRTFAPQHEILDYLKHCADKYDVRKHIRFGTNVEETAFDEKTGLWEVKTNQGSFSGRVLVLATGGLSRPMVPTLAGQANFQGRAFHSARWDHAASFAGKSVGVIGTGASAIQIIPEIAREAGRLVVFQRTAPWVLPKPDHPIPREARERFRRSWFSRWLERTSLYLRIEARLLALVRRPNLMRYAEKSAVAFIEANVSDPALRKKLTPDYRMGCKRILMSNDYYRALAQPNVEVVTEAIGEVTPLGIRTSDGREHGLDAIVYATGFQVGDSVAPFRVQGAGGRELADDWKNGAEAYLGATVPGYPNLFFLSGPNTGLSHNSIIFMHESLTSYILDAVRTIRSRGLDGVSVRPDASVRYNNELQARFPGTVWASGCKSWYQAGNGKNVVIWPGFTFDFRRRTRRFDISNYDVLVAGDGNARAEPEAPSVRPRVRREAAASLGR